MALGDLDDAARRMFERMPRTHHEPRSRRQMALRPDEQHAEFVEALINTEAAMADVLEYGRKLADLPHSPISEADLLHVQQMRMLVLNAARRASRKEG